MGKFQSTKVFDGFSTVFRQWRAENTHCRFLHGYGIKFKVTFQGDLDYRNWVWDFGGMKRANTKIDGMSAKEWMDYMFDHTVIAASDDPELNFLNLFIINLIILYYRKLKDELVYYQLNFVKMIKIVQYITSQ